MKYLILALLCISGCAHNDITHKEPSKDYSEETARLRSLHDAWKSSFGDSWAGRDCDGMIWNGKAGIFIESLNVLDAESKSRPGKFHRRTDPYCWTKEGGDQGSKTDWSRDMAICGLYPWLWRTKNLDAAERHAEYGKENLWKMGSPLSDGRVLYTPQIVGMLYEIIYALGGEDSIGREWESSYPSGLTDYTAHLQICSIWLRGEIAEHHREQKNDAKEFEFGEITEKMFSRIEEHYGREPSDHFYAYMHGLYSGDYGPAVSACLDDSNNGGSYVRCGGHNDCGLASKIFACGMLIERLDK